MLAPPSATFSLKQTPRDLEISYNTAKAGGGGMDVDFPVFHKAATKRMQEEVPVGIFIRKLQRLRLKVGLFEARYFCNKYVSLFKIGVC